MKRQPLLLGKCIPMITRSAGTGANPFQPFLHTEARLADRALNESAMRASQAFPRDKRGERILRA
jgi:hypothetical protein